MMRRMGIQSTLCFLLAAAVARAALIPASAEPRLTFAQAGPAGEVSVAPPAGQAPITRKHQLAITAQRARPPKPEGQSKKMPGKFTPRMALGGRWNWYATCELGSADGAITVVQTTASTFHGSFSRQWPADVGIITGGKIRGKRVSFLLHQPGQVERYDTYLVSMAPPTVKGYHVVPYWGACQFTATKM